MSESIITVENLSKKYVISHKQEQRYTAMRDVLVNGAKNFGKRLVGRQTKSASKEDFWALKDINFEIKQGDRVGIIGRNGAGKSTLLKILSRITEPTTGKIHLKGRVASLLEVGTGFHPELTGRENIFLNGAIMGMSKWEIKKKFDEIVAFAEVEKFLDTPVKRYSSGMYVRLAFAVAAHLEPEILIVDEVLAVGDAQFQKKCLGKMEDVGKEGRTVIFVSHNMEILSQLCNLATLLTKGKLVQFGEAKEVVDQYSSLPLSLTNSGTINFEESNNRNGTFVQLIMGKGDVNTFCYRESVQIIIKYRLHVNITGFHVALHLQSSNGTVIFSSADTDSNSVLFGLREKGDYLAKILIPLGDLNAGLYSLRLSMGIPGNEIVDNRDGISLNIEPSEDIVFDYGTRRRGLMFKKLEWLYA